MWKSVSTTTQPSPEKLDDDPALSCMGINILGACRPAVLAVTTNYLGVIQVESHPQDELCEVQTVIGDASQIPDPSLKYKANLSATCSLAGIRQFFGTTAGEGFARDLGIVFDTSHPGAYTVNIMYAIGAMTPTPPSETGCVVNPPFFY